MAKNLFKTENQLWKTRATHGVPKIFGTPEIMLDAAREYFEWCDESPLYGHEWRDGRLRQIPYKRPYSIKGLCLFWGVTESYLRVFKHSLPGANETNNTSDFLTVIEVIHDSCFQQKFDGAAVGFFNANLISRDLGLADKRQVDANINLSDRDILFE